MQRVIQNNRHWFSVVKIQLVFLMLVFGETQASQSFTPNDVFSKVEFSIGLVDRLLKAKNIKDIQIPISRELDAKPMHVYELQVSVLAELYSYALKQKRRPPMLAVSTPIKYTPTDVYYLTQLVTRSLEDIFHDAGGFVDFSLNLHTDKSPAEVYQGLFELYYKLNLLNGKSKVSPNEVYAHIFRAKEGLQLSLLTLAKRLDNKEEVTKRLLVTAIYGMHPDGSMITQLEPGKKPGDVMVKAISLRGKLNELRKRNQLPEINQPKSNDFAAVKPIDIFLQTQFIIAELNLLKIPMGITSTTISPKSVTGKTPSDVYQEMRHIDYMLDRLIQAL